MGHGLSCSIKQLRVVFTMAAFRCIDVFLILNWFEDAKRSQHLQLTYEIRSCQYVKSG